jgi:hypothetical protein
MLAHITLALRDFELEHHSLDSGRMQLVVRPLRP